MFTITVIFLNYNIFKVLFELTLLLFYCLANKNSELRGSWKLPKLQSGLLIHIGIVFTRSPFRN